MTRAGRLLGELHAAYARGDTRRTAALLQQLLPLTMNALDFDGADAFIQGLQVGCFLGLAQAAPDDAEWFLGLLNTHLHLLGSEETWRAARPVLASIEAEIASLRAQGVTSRDDVAILFDRFQSVLGPEAVGRDRTPAAAAKLLGKLAAPPFHRQARAALTTQVDFAIRRVAMSKFQAGRGGELIAWLEAVEPFLPLSVPEKIFGIIAEWAICYGNTALHGNAFDTLDDVLDRFECLMDATSLPADHDPVPWEKAKAETRLFVGQSLRLDRARFSGDYEEARRIARDLLDRLPSSMLKPEFRSMLEHTAQGRKPGLMEFPGHSSSSRDLHHHIRRLMQVLASIQARRPEIAAGLLADLTAGAPEKDRDLASGVPDFIGICMGLVAPAHPRLVGARIALLKEAVRQLELQRLDVADQVPGALNLLDASPVNVPYMELRHLLLQHSRIGEAIRVENLLAEQDYRLPVAKDRTLADQAAERLPRFPGEVEYWKQVKMAAVALMQGQPLQTPQNITVDGIGWMRRMLDRAPVPDLARNTQLAPLLGRQPGDGELFLSIMAVKGGIFSIVRGPNHLEHTVFTELPHQELSEAVLALQMAIRQQDWGIRPVADKLGAMLLAPLEGLIKRLAPRRLVLEPAGVICHVPFAALRLAGAYLAERHELVLWGGGAVSSDREGGVVSIGAAHSARQSALDWVEKDMQLVADYACRAGLRPDGFKGDDARRDAILRRLSTPPRILHISSHFKAELLNMAESAFLLAGNERLTVADLSRCALKGCDLALLLGCETVARPPVAPDSPIVGVDAALLRLGVKSVVSCQWPVDDHACHLFLKSLLEALAIPGTDKATAVNRAQLSVMTAPAGHLGHPAFWAGFVLTGQP